MAAADGGVWLNLVYQTQQTSYYCVPASTRALLTANVSSPPAQATIARQEGTDSGGTYFPNAVGTLNAWQSRNPYVDSNPSNATTLYNDVNLDVSNYNSATMADVRGGDLPLWQSIGWDGHHAVVQFGDYGDGGTIRMWDPINNSAINGRSAISDSTLYYAMNDSGNGITVNDNLIW